MELIEKININNLLNFSNSEDKVLRYLINRDEEKVILASSYENTKMNLAKAKIENLKLSKDLFISRIKNGRKEEKIKSLEERFYFEKNQILSETEKRLYFYKDDLNKILNIINCEKINFEVEFEAQNIVKTIIFSVKIFNNDGDIYIENLRNDDVYLKSSDEAIKLDSIELKKYLKIINNEYRYYLYKNNKNIEIILKDKGLQRRLLTNKIEIYNKNMINGIYDYKKIIEKNKKDMIILEDDKKEREILIKQILIDEILNGAKISILKNEKIANVIFNVKSEEIKKEIDEIEKKLDRYKTNKCMFSKNITTSMNLLEVMQNIREYEYIEADYENYKKNLNLSSVDYNKFLNVLNNIFKEDILNYKSYQNLKQNINYFNEFSFMEEKDLDKLLNIIESIKLDAQHMYKNYKMYYKKIIFKIKVNRHLLDSNEILNLAKIINLEKKESNKSDKKNKGIAKFLFLKKKETQSDNTINQEIEILKKVYKAVETNLNNLYNLNEYLFLKVSSILQKDSFNENIDSLISNIKLTKHNKNLLVKINSWDNTKNAIVEYISSFNNFEKACEDIKIFKLLDIVNNFSKENNIDLDFEYQLFVNFDTKIVNKREFLKKELLNECIEFTNYNEKKEIKHCDLLIIDSDYILDDEKIIECISESTRFISFRDNKISELEQSIAK